ncbi:MAG: type VI secretion system tube protein Hcp [Desulfatitalea sp.]
MGFDAFMHIDGIQGESSDERHAGWIEILNFNLGVGQRVSRTAGSAGGAGAERADLSEFTLAKLLDMATPQLALACAAGTHIDKIVVEICRAGKDKVKFMEYRFTNCLISAFSTSSDNGEFPVDDVAVNYGKIEWCYTRQSRADGGAMGNIAAGWSLEKNCKA